jgi:hypothetical protein
MNARALCLALLLLAPALPSHAGPKKGAAKKVSAIESLSVNFIEPSGLLLPRDSAPEVLNLPIVVRFGLKALTPRTAKHERQDATVDVTVSEERDDVSGIKPERPYRATERRTVKLSENNEFVLTLSPRGGKDYTSEDCANLWVEVTVELEGQKLAASGILTLIAGGCMMGDL